MSNFISLLMTPEVLRIIGLGCTFAGSLVLALRLVNLIGWIVASIKGILLSLKTMVSRDIVLFEGFDEKLSQAQEQSSRWLKIGATLVVIGFAIQLLPAILKLST